MATALKIPRVQNTLAITIAPGGTISNAQGYLWVADNTSIEWSNTGTAEYDIVFTIGGLPAISVPGGTTSSSITDSATSVNYVIQKNGIQISGPYCIQWGNGALQVNVSSNSAQFTVAVPATTPTYMGNIQFTSDANYKITWSNNIWSPQPSEVYPTPPGNPVQQARLGASGPVTCTFSGLPKVPSRGTVHVGS